MQLMRGLSTRCHCYGVCLKQVHPDHHTQHLKSLEQNTHNGDEHFAVIKEGAKMHALRV